MTKASIECIKVISVWVWCCHVMAGLIKLQHSFDIMIRAQRYLVLEENMLEQLSSGPDQLVEVAR